ncbi:MAG TPA: S8 family serine peptidase [Pricia sp.]|nr:S8 family serine peptidase [Pricia sp.]
MKTIEAKFSVQVIDADQQAITNAKVTVTSERHEYTLACENRKGIYTTEEDIRKGMYVISVKKRPFEEDSRKVEIGKRTQKEVFILRGKGEPYYYRGKVKTPFRIHEDRIALLIPEKTALASKGKKKEILALNERRKIANALAKKHKISLEKTHENLLSNGVFVCSFPKSATKKDKMEICERIEKEESNTALPILKLTEKHAALLTNEMMVKFEDGIEKSEVEKLAKEYGLKIKRKISALGNFYHLTTGKVPTYDTLEIINKLAEHEDVVFAEPNLATTVEEDAITPTDFLFPEQWDHQILNTPDAWQFLRNVNVDRTFGSPNVIIGVVDSGVDPNHPDFSGTVSDGSPKIYQAFDFANMVANTNSLSSGHGTACASAAASSSNNASAVAGTNEGVTGVAGNCRVLAIRRDGTESKYADIYLWAGGFDPESDEDDFPAPISPGADVISSSIGIGSAIGSPTSGTMAAVFDKLTDDGRDGKGVLLFFSAANNGSDNDLVFDRPWGMYDRCFSIAASTLANDGVTEIQAGYSNFSSLTEFCAPSHDAYISGSPLHNPPTNYGAFTATPTTGAEGHGTVGRPTAQTTLSVNAVTGANTISVNSVAGMANGQALMIGNPGGGNTEAHMITNINNANNQVTLNRNLFNNQGNGTTVTVTTWDYRSNFGGTSHATPLCAGTAALMLSANPQLTWQQVRDLMRETAVKINPGETNANGRWQDVNGNLSNAPAYDGNPFFSEFYGYGRINTAAAVREAGWDIDLITDSLDFNDVPEGDTVSRAIRFNVKSLWAANFTITDGPGSPFNPLSTTESLGSSSDSSLVREVYLWITYRGTNTGDQITMADGRTVTVQNPETEQEWNIPITANVIERPSAAIMLCLDQSGSMDAPSGIGTSKRIDVLRFSANIMIDVLHEGNGLGIVSFDHDPHDIFNFRGPVGPAVSPSNPFDQDRADMKGAIANFNPNPSGLTAIGDGIERAWTKLNPVSGYDSKSVIVFTDGKETAAKYISEVTDQINDRMFAIGLGKAENIEPAALNEAVNSSDGYMLLANDLGMDSIFKLAKYFLQIQAEVNNEEIVVDPDGTLYPGQIHKIPFTINEADNTIDVIAMVPHPSALEFHLETPNGHSIKPGDSGVIPGVLYSYGNNVVFYRLNLPLPIGVPEREGTWNAILAVNKKYRGHQLKHTAVVNTQDASTSHGNIGRVPYSLLVHSSSNLTMETRVRQSDYEPGATIKLNVRLRQFGIPLDTQCSVVTDVTLPNKQVKTLPLTNLGDGNYETQLVADSTGTYQFLTKAKGFSFRGKAFSREQVRNASVWRGGNRPSPEGNGTGTSGTSKEELCKLISCLMDEKNISQALKKRLLEQGIHVDGMLACLKKYCKDSSSSGLTRETLSKLKLDYEVLLKTFSEILT